MSGINRKIKRSKALSERKEKKLDAWENLMEMRKSTIDTYIKQHSLLIETQKLFKDTIAEDEIASQIVKGANDSFKEIAEKIKFTMDKHITFEEDPEGKGNIIKDYKKGIIPKDSDELFDYLSVMNDYIAVHTDLMNVGTSSHITLLDRLKVFSNSIKEKDIDMLKTAYSKGQDEIIESIKEVSGGKSKRKRK